VRANPFWHNQTPSLRSARGLMLGGKFFPPSRERRSRFGGGACLVVSEQFCFLFLQLLLGLSSAYCGGPFPRKIRLTGYVYLIISLGSLDYARDSRVWQPLHTISGICLTVNPFWHNQTASLRSP